MNGLILDIIVVVVALLLLLFGFWRGMYKLIFGLVSSLAAIVLAVVLASTVTSFVIQKTNLDTYLYKALDEKVQSAIPADMNASDVSITFKVDDTVSITYGANEYESISAYLQENSSSMSMLGGTLDSALTNENTISILIPDQDPDNPVEHTTTLARVMSALAIMYILYACVFVLLWILCYIVVRFLMFLLKKVVRGTYIGHFVDKLLGLVIGAAFFLVLAWGSLAVIRMLGTYTWIIPANELINSSTVTKLLYENNYLYNILVQRMNLQDVIGGLFGNKGGEEAEEAARMIANAFKPEFLK